MTLNEFEAKIAKIKEEYPEAGDLDIGPVFNFEGEPILMYINDIFFTKDGGHNFGDGIGIHWNC